MNVRRGYRRLAIAIVGVWVVTWGCVAGYAAWQQGIWTNIFLKAAHDENMTTLITANEKSQWYAKLITRSLVAEAMTIPIAILLALGWWVYRGFSVRQEQN